MLLQVFFDKPQTKPNSVVVVCKADVGQKEKKKKKKEGKRKCVTWFRVLRYLFEDLQYIFPATAVGVIH